MGMVVPGTVGEQAAALQKAVAAVTAARELVAEQRAELREAEVAIGRADVLRRLLALADDPTAYATARVRALELVGKHFGMFVERSESRNFNVNVDGSRVVYRLALGEAKEESTETP